MLIAQATLNVLMLNLLSLLNSLIQLSMVFLQQSKQQLYTAVSHVNNDLLQALEAQCNLS